jgi:hypothetical protein
LQHIGARNFRHFQRNPPLGHFHHWQVIHGSSTEPRASDISRAVLIMASACPDRRHWLAKPRPFRYQIPWAALSRYPPSKPRVFPRSATRAPHQNHLGGGQRRPEFQRPAGRISVEACRIASPWLDRSRSAERGPAAR